MNLLAVDFSNIEELLTPENIRFAITMVVYVITGAIAIYKTGQAQIEKMKRKKAENERDEAYIALNSAQKTMINVLDGMSILVNSSRNVDDAEKTAFNQVIIKQADVIKESNSLIQPLLEGFRKDAQEFLDDVKEDAMEAVVGLGGTVLSNYINQGTKQ